LPLSRVLFFLCKGTTCASFKFIRECWCFKGFINDNIINNQTEVAETFNNFFVNVAKDIGSQNIKTYDYHPSIKAIKENKTETD
jgi:hypothetical protein